MHAKRSFEVAISRRFADGWFGGGVVVYDGTTPIRAV
jgi:hypothetical protein